MERHANLGYIAFKRQASKLAVADTPDLYLPVYGADVNTTPNFQAQNPIIGNKFARRSTLRGQREHTGSITLEGEPVSASIAMDMLLTRGSETGGGPYTNPYTLSKTADPAYYTADVSYVTHVVRYIGLTAGQIDEEWEDNELRLNCTVSALKVWDGREIAGVSSQEITFKQDYDRRPTDGLVADDTLQIFDVSTGNYIDCTVATVDSATQITVTGTITAAGAGDFITIKPASAPSYSSGPTFTWANTEYRFGANAAGALTATHTPLETDTSLSLQHPFEDEAGAKRSGSFDPASLPRLQGLYEFTTKKYFDTPEGMLAYSNMAKSACVVRHFAYSGSNTYELRITLNNMTSGNPRPNLSSEEILYSETEFSGNYDSSDTHGMQATVISPVSIAS